MGLETVAIGLGIAALAGGAAVGIEAATGTGMFAKKPDEAAPAAKVEPLPTAPSPGTALVDAQKQADDRRKTILSSGGNTILTSQGMPGMGSGGQGKTLLGS